MPRGENRGQFCRNRVCFVFQTRFVAVAEVVSWRVGASRRLTTACEDNRAVDDHSDILGGGERR
jgi:hypothetical protein